MIVEVCANSIESAINAEKAGADRIELCSELAVGGVTPSFGLIKHVLREISLPVHVLIRPRSGDFTYSDREFAIMKEDIRICMELGVSGIVSGVLTNAFSIDEERTNELVRETKPQHFTFHRAFDWVKEPKMALMALENMGVNTILTSGQKSSAIEGLPQLQLWDESMEKCSIMPGGGINPKNVEKFVSANFQAIHLSGTKFRHTLREQPAISMNNENFLNDDRIAESDVEILSRVVAIVKNNLKI